MKQSETESRGQTPIWPLDQFARLVGKIAELDTKIIAAQVTADRVAELVRDLETATRTDRDYVSKLENRVADLEESHCLLSQAVGMLEPPAEIPQAVREFVKEAEEFRITGLGEYISESGLIAEVTRERLRDDAERLWDGFINGVAMSWYDDGRCGLTEYCLVGRIPRLASALPENLESELSELVNKYGRENKSDTPDFLLASFILSSLEAFEIATKRRDMWFGFHPLGHESETTPPEVEKTQESGRQSIPIPPAIQREVEEVIAERREANLATWPSQQWLRKIVHAEDACESVSVGGLAADTGQPLPPAQPAKRREWWPTSEIATG